jgi:hypothetical protein
VHNATLLEDDFLPAVGIQEGFLDVAFSFAREAEIITAGGVEGGR